MKNTVLFSLFILFISCNDYYEDTYVHISADLPRFDYIESYTSEDVFIHESNRGSYIDIIIPEVFADNLDYWIEGNTLIIDKDGRLRGEIEIHVFTPYVGGLYNYRSGRIFSDDYLPNDDFLELYNDGSGRIDVNVRNRSTEATIRSSGRIEIHGRTNDLDVLIESSGDFYGHGLDSRDARIETVSSGSARVRCSNYLQAYIFSSGNIHLRGNPIIDLVDEGSGELIW